MLIKRISHDAESARQSQYTLWSVDSSRLIGVSNEEEPQGAAPPPSMRSEGM